jgi:hypothetical protein
MAEYIKRADAMEAIRKWCGDCGSAIEAVLSVPAARGWEPDGATNLPAADVAQVVHGEWLLRHEGRGHYWECSVCHENPCIYVTKHTKFCPNCGAKMDGDSDES